MLRTRVKVDGHYGPWTEYVNPEPTHARRVCAACSAEATSVERVDHRQVSVRRDGSTSRAIAIVGTFYCDRHTGAAA